MRAPPLAIPGDSVSGSDGHCTPFNRVVDTKTPLAGNDGGVSAAVVVARVAHISIAVGGNIGPLDVVMVVVEGKVLVGEVSVGVTGTPLVVHHLDMNKVGSRGVELRLHSTDTGKSGTVESLDEGGRRWSVGFVDELDGTSAPEVGVGVDDVGDPFEELVGTFVIVIVVESGRWCELAGERL